MLSLSLWYFSYFYPYSYQDSYCMYDVTDDKMFVLMWTVSLYSVFVSATGVLQPLWVKDPRKH